MNLNDLLLKKDELPIISKTAFQVPIHPKLLEATLNPDIAHDVFSQTAEEWYSDLKEYVKNLDDYEEKDWIRKAFLKKKPYILKEYGNQIVKPLGIWEDLTQNSENGFARVLSINRNAGGTLFFDPDNQSSYAMSRYIKFNEEKLAEYQDPEKLKGWVFHYSQHNVDNYPGALFLRNWAILYLNQALKQIF